MYWQDGLPTSSSALGDDALSSTHACGPEPFAAPLNVHKERSWQNRSTGLSPIGVIVCGYAGTITEDDEATSMPHSCLAALGIHHVVGCGILHWDARPATASSCLPDYLRLEGWRAVVGEQLGVHGVAAGHLEAPLVPHLHPPPPCPLPPPHRSAITHQLVACRLAF